MKLRAVLSFVSVSIFVFASADPVSAQSEAFRPASVSKAAKLIVPKSARGLTGTIRVRVSVDTKGSVGSVEQVLGPGDICPAVSRPDIDAIRAAAKDAALRSKFDPAMLNGNAEAGSAWVEFELPEKKESGPPKDSDKVTLVAGDYNAAAPAARNETGSPLQLKSGVLNGKAQSLPKPRYPAAARAVRASGAVPVQVLIYEDGTIFSARAVSGHPLLRANAVASACGARFSPTLLSGQPVRVSGIITYNFVP